MAYMSVIRMLLSGLRRRISAWKTSLDCSHLSCKLTVADVVSVIVGVAETIVVVVLIFWVVVVETVEFCPQAADTSRTARSVMVIFLAIFLTF